MFKSSTISGPVAVAGLAFMLALGGCSSGSDAPPEPEVTEPMPEPDPEPTDLEKTQMAAKAAADAAKMASDGAATAASGADAATMKHATRQTGEMARMYAMDADKYAKMAMAAYMDAKAASDAAAAAIIRLSGPRACSIRLVAGLPARSHILIRSPRAPSRWKCSRTSPQLVPRMLASGSMRRCGRQR